MVTAPVNGSASTIETVPLIGKKSALVHPGLFKIVPDETNSTSGDGGFVMAYHGKFPTPTIETGLLIGKEMEREPPDKEPEVTTADWASLLL